MNGPIDLAAGVGGILHLAYSCPGASASHAIHLAVLPFESTPSGALSDYPYRTDGPIVPLESGILATVAALGAVWATYYSPIWSLRLVRVLRNVAGFALAQPIVPQAPAVYGTANPDSDPDLVVKRTLSMFSYAGSRWRTWLRQMPGVSVGQRVGVGTETGGIDERDQAWFGYISSDATGIVARDGTRFQPGGRVRQWWDRPLADTLADSSYLVSG